jgi:antirestriction protein
VSEQLGGHETPPKTPRTYLRDNGAAVKGVERGRWLDATAEPEELEAVQHELVSTSPWAGTTASIRQHTHFEGLEITEHEDLATVSRLARGGAAHGRAFVAYVDAWGTDQAAVDAFPNYYIGSWRDLAAWAETVVEEQGWWDQLNKHIDGRLLPYIRIGYERLGRELAYDTYVAEDDERSQVHIFRLRA